jgi:hypothetical protein
VIQWRVYCALSAEVLYQHQIVHFLVEARSQQCAAVRGERHIGIIPYRFFVQRQQRSNLPRRKAPEADDLAPFLLGYEINPLWTERAKTIHCPFGEKAGSLAT